VLSFGLLWNLDTQFLGFVPMIITKERSQTLQVSWPKCLHRFNSSLEKRGCRISQDVRTLNQPPHFLGFHYKTLRNMRRSYFLPTSFPRVSPGGGPKAPRGNARPARASPGLARACGAQSPLARSRVRGASPLAGSRVRGASPGLARACGAGLPVAGRHSRASHGPPGRSTPSHTDFGGYIESTQRVLTMYESV